MVVPDIFVQVNAIIGLITVVHFLSWCIPEINHRLRYRQPRLDRKTIARNHEVALKNLEISAAKAELLAQAELTRIEREKNIQLNTQLEDTLKKLVQRVGSI